MGITNVYENEADMVPRPRSGTEMFCKESAKSHDYFDSRVAHRSRRNHITPLSGPLGDSK